MILLITLGTVNYFPSNVSSIASQSLIVYTVYSHKRCANTWDKIDLYQMCKSTSTVIRHTEHFFAKHSAVPKRDFQYHIPAGPVHAVRDQMRETERDI